MKAFSELLSLDPDVTRLQFETLYLGKRDNDKKIKVSSQLEMRTGDVIADSDLISPELAAARADWNKIEVAAAKLSKVDKDAFFAKKRAAHFKKHPILSKYQGLINSQSSSKKDLIDLLEIAPYAKFNIEQFAKEQNISVEEVFTTELKADRISVLSTDQLRELKLANRELFLVRVSLLRVSYLASQYESTREEK